MRRAPRVELAKAERAELEEWVRHRPPTDRLSLRAQVVLLAADGAPNSSIAMAPWGCIPRPWAGGGIASS